MMCPNCGGIQTAEIRKGIKNKVIKCIYCNKSRKLKYKNKFGLQAKILFKTNSPQEASIVCMERKKERWRNKK